MDRREWLEARRKGIGGSDVAPILGLSKYRSAIDVYEDKLGLSADRPATPPQRWGLLLEDAVSRAYVEERHLTVRRVGIRRAKHVPGFPMIGSIDRVAYGPGVPSGGVLVEIKTSRHGDGYAKTEEARDLPPEKRVPTDAFLQTQHYLEVARLELAVVVVLVAGSELRMIDVPRDHDIGADLIEEEGRFWRDYVEAGVVPPAGPDDGGYLLRRFPTAIEDEKVATAEVELVLDRLFAVEAELERLGTEKEAAKAKLKEYLGTAKKLIAGSGSATWSRFERTTTGWKEYASSLEELAAQLATALVVDPIVEGAARKDPELAVALDVVADRFAAIRGLYSRTAPAEQFVTRKKEG